MRSIDHYTARRCQESNAPKPFTGKIVVIAEARAPLLCIIIHRECMFMQHWTRGAGSGEEGRFAAERIFILV
jgi:hypothetical protein